MYDEIVTNIDLTADEVNLIKELLFYRLDECTSVGEEITVKDLLEKLQK